MEAFTTSIVVQKDDLDNLEHVNNVRYVQWMQDIAKEHWVSKAPLQIQKEVVWVVLSHYVQYKGAAKLQDTLLLKTYITKTKGAVCVRVVEMYLQKTNMLLVRSETEWCLLNAKTRKPQRISEEIATVFMV